MNKDETLPHSLEFLLPFFKGWLAWCVVMGEGLIQGGSKRNWDIPGVRSWLLKEHLTAAVSGTAFSLVMSHFFPIAKEGRKENG